jgi:hypothetical protein
MSMDVKLAVLVAVGAFVMHVRGQVPPRYEIVNVTNDSLYQRNVRMNNRGQIVFWAGSGTNGNTYEIYLYDHGRLTRITENAVCDGYPDINDQGTIVWERFIGPQGPYGPTSEVMMYRDGVTTQLTHDAVDNVGPRINNLGHIVWYDWVRGGCLDSNAIVKFYDGQEIDQISDADWSNQGPEINDRDWIVWTRYNYCDDPWSSSILLCTDGVTTTLTTDEIESQVPTINNVGQVCWSCTNPVTHDKEILLWQDGLTTILTDWGMNGRLNNHGDVYFIRWYEAQQTYQAWLYLRGRFYQLTDDPAWFWNVDGDISDTGEVAWAAGRIVNYRSDVRYLHRVPPHAQGAQVLVEPISAQPITP